MMFGLFKREKRKTKRRSEIVECVVCGMAIKRDSANVVEVQNYEFSESRRYKEFYCKKHEKPYDLKIRHGMDTINCDGTSEPCYWVTYFKKVSRVEVTKKGKFISISD